MYSRNTYVSVAEQTERSARAARKLRATGFNPSPVKAFSGPMVRTDLGKAWCANIENYTGDTQRLSRGKRYLRAGSVCHLQIEQGKISAMVSGSRLYSARVEVSPLPAEKWRVLLRAASGDLTMSIELARGRIPPEIMRLVASRSGLFPEKSEIDFHCSCPDSAYLCKHVAAAMYAFGLRLDAEPGLLFELRGVNMDELFSSGLSEMIAAAPGGGTDISVADKASLENMFGIELDMD